MKGSQIVGSFYLAKMRSGKLQMNSKESSQAWGDLLSNHPLLRDLCLTRIPGREGENFSPCWVSGFSNIRE